MGGPGVDPSYNGSTTEAYAWGQRQAARAVADANGQPVKYRVLFMDVELPGVAPAHDNGWNSVYTSPCSGVTRSSYVPASVDRADFNGFFDYEKAARLHARCLLRAGDLGLDLRHRRLLDDREHRRVDV